MLVLWAVVLAGPARAQRALHDHTPGLGASGPLTAFAESASDRRFLAVGGADGRVYLSADRGQTWTSAVAVLPGTDRDLGGFRAQDLTGDLETEPLDPGTVPSLRNYLSGVAPNESFNDVDGDDLNLVFPRLRLFGPYEELVDRADDPTMEATGAGLGASAPRFSALLSRRPTAATTIHALDLDPGRPEVVLAAAADGLRRSVDGGQTWPAALGVPAGADAAFFALLRDPRRPQRIFAGGAAGLYVSGDGGDRFFALPAPEVAEAEVRALAWHPSDPRTFLVGTAEGLLRTADGGRTFEALWADDTAELASVRAVIFDPRQPARVLLGTDDGLLLSADGGRTFARAGGLQFAGQRVRAVAAGAGSGQFVVATDDDLWESLDGGVSWRMAWLGGGPHPLRQAVVSPHGDDDLWVLTAGEVLRLAPGAAPVLTVFGRNAWEALREKEPRLGEVLDRAAARFGVVDAEGGGGGSARWSHLLPRVVAGVYGFNVNLPGGLREIYVLGGPERFLNDTAIARWPQAFVFGTWDLAALLHAGEDDGGTSAGQRALARQLRETVTALYQERRQLQLGALQLGPPVGDAARAPAALRTRLLHALRIEELTAQLNALAGPVFPEADALEQVLGGR